MACPKHQDTYNPGWMNKTVYPPIKDNFKKRGCHEFKSSIWSVSEEVLSDDERAAAPLIGVVLPSPDPTGSQGMGGDYGVGRDILFEQLFQAHGRKPLRIGLFYLTRGYSFHKTFRREIVAATPHRAAISYCSPYMERDIATVKPDKLLICGQEALNVFFPGNPELATMRREWNHTLTINQHTMQVQVTFNPHFAAIMPVYIKPIQDDCKKLFTPEVLSAPTSYRILDNLDDVLEYIDYLHDYPGYISVDTETQNLFRKATNKLAMIQFATNNNKGVVLPYQHWQTPFSPDELKIITKRLHKLFSTPIASKGWIAHGAKFEHSMFDMHLGTMMDSADVFCTQAMAFLLDETRSERKADRPKDHGLYTLKILAWDLLNFTGYNAAILKARGEGALYDLPLKELADYGAMDAVIGHRLFFRILELAKDQNYEETLHRFTRLFYGPITKLVSHIERTGFKVDLRSLRKLSNHTGPFDMRMEDLTNKLKALEPFHEANKLLVQQKNAGRTTGVMGDVPWVFDFNKTDHQALAFFKVMELEPVSFAEKTGRPAIDEDFFEAYCSDPSKGVEGELAVDLFYKYHETKHIRDTFITKMMERIDPEVGDEDCRMDQRIRPDIHYSRLVTGRLAIVNPNLGQIPKAEENPDPNEYQVRRAVKDLFTVDRGAALLQVDYKVNEVRWAAILAKDAAMADIFVNAAKRIKDAVLSGDVDQIKLALFLEDIHRNTASAAFNVPITDVTKKQRQAAKSITFGILFQQSTKALAAAIKVTEEEALEFQRIFFSKMTGVAGLITDLKDQARTKGFVEAPHGRRRRFWSFYLPDTYPYKKNHEARNLRQAVNSPIQGIASDGAMYGGAYSLLEYIRKEKRSWLIQNIVHDSCLIQITDAREASEAMQKMESIFVDEAMRKMEGMGVKFNLPLGIDVEAGIPKWGSLEKWNGTAKHADELQQITLDWWSQQ